jgi:cytoskeletal protein CcmA (bactofilin family)
MIAFVPRLIMRTPGARWGLDRMDTSARAQDSSPLSISTIGEELTITGNVTSNGELHLNGQIQGDVHCVALVLGENAQLKGGVVAEDVMVRGHLIGSVRALTVVLQSTSHVEGNLIHKSLAIEHGTHFEGESRPSEDPLASNPEVAAAEPQLNHNGRPDAVKQRERGNGFIKSLPESPSA